MLIKNVDKTVKLKYLSNLWKTLGMQLINWEIDFILTLTGNSVLSIPMWMWIKQQTSQ